MSEDDPTTDGTEPDSGDDPTPEDAPPDPGDDPTPGDAPTPATDADVAGGTDPVTWRVLVPVAVLEGETVPESIAELLGSLPVTVLGYHVIPEQTAPGQARMQFEDRAQEKVADLVTLFRAAGGDVDSRLVFTHDEEQTIDRVAEETGCTAVLVPNPTGAVERVLVPVGGEVDAARIADFVAALVGDSEIAVTLLNVAPEGKEAAGRAILSGAGSQLRGAGLTSVTEEVVGSDTPVEAIATAAEDHDVVVMGESQPSLRAFVFGDPSDRVADSSVGPVFVVRRPRPAPEDGEADTDDGDDTEGAGGD